MFETLLTVLPVFILLGIGYLASALSYLPKNFGEILNIFAVRLAVPVLLFRAMINLDLSGSFNFPMLASYYVAALFCFIIGIVLARLIWKRRPGESIAVGFCALFSNSLLLGIAIVERAFGGDAAGLALAFTIVAFHAPLLYTVGMITMEFSREDGQAFWSSLKAALGAILKNSLMIGIAIGIAFNLAQIELPDFVAIPVDKLADAAIPIALVGLGATMRHYKIKADFSEALMVSALALIVHPLLALLIAISLNGAGFFIAGDAIRVATIMAAMPPGMNVYIFAAMYKRAEGLAATSVLIATALSVFSISAWLWALEQML